MIISSIIRAREILLKWLAPGKTRKCETEFDAAER